MTAAFKDGLISLATSQAFKLAGDNFPGAFENTVAHGFIGCASAVASGGRCGQGAMAGALSAAAANYGVIKESWGPAWGATASAMIGGTASVLGGGKFENGAVTGAFGYLFNYWDHIGKTVGGAVGAISGVAMSTGCDMLTASVCMAVNAPLVGGMMAVGATTGEMVGRAFDSAVDTAHANSLNFSGRTTKVYQLISDVTGEVMKYGITSNPNEEWRYTQAYYRDKAVTMEVIAEYPMRWMARTHERMLCYGYAATHGTLPALSKVCHVQFISDMEKP